MMNKPNVWLLEFYGGYDRWKEEHDELQGRLQALCRYMRAGLDQGRTAGWDRIHGEVREQFLAFMKDWKNYVRLESKIIYPAAVPADRSGPSGDASLLMKDCKLAEEFYEAYLAACREGASDEEALERLFQSLMIIAEHFRIEEENVLPQTERIMDEIAYNGC